MLCHTPRDILAVESLISNFRGKGQPLAKTARAFFEPRFGQDLSNVRVHTDSRAAETAGEIKARAYTSGHNIVFGAGQYTPETSEGRRLLAHELTHVIQQRTGLAKSAVQGGGLMGKQMADMIIQRSPYRAQALSLEEIGRDVYKERLRKQSGQTAAKVCRSIGQALTPANCPTVLPAGGIVTVLKEKVSGLWLQIDCVGLSGFGPKEQCHMLGAFARRLDPPKAEETPTPKSEQKPSAGSEAGTTSDRESICAALRSALANSIQVIELYNQFQAGKITWEAMIKQIRQIGNAAQGVVGTGRQLPKVVQDAINEVESFGFEEIEQMERLLAGTPSLIFGSGDYFRQQWVTNEIERQNHYNLVLIRLMYENTCPDVPGTWAGYQQQIIPIGTKGMEQRSTIESPRKTRTALAWVQIGEEFVLVLTTEVEYSGSLRFERWIDSEFRELALSTARSRQGSIPSVPGSAVTGLPLSVPSSAARR